MTGGAVLGLVLTVIACMRWAPFWDGDRAFYLLDVLHQAYPWQAAIDLVLARSPGNPPLWNPYSLCGSPLLADPQAQVLYPPAVVFRLMPFAAAYGTWLALHSVIATTGMAAFLLDRGLGRLAVLLGAMGFAFGAHPSLLSFNPQTSAGYAWLPWVAILASLLARKRGPTAVVGLGIVLAWTVLAGSLQHALIAGALAFVVLVTDCPDRRLKVLAWGGIGVLIAVAVSLPMLWPAFRYIKYGTVRGFPLGAEAASIGEFPLRNLAGYLLPLSVWTGGGGSAALSGHWLGLHCVGSLMIPLAIAGVAVRGSVLRGAMLMCVIGVSVGIGRELPFVGAWIRQMPPLCYTRNSGMWLALADFGLAWMGAVGLGVLRERLAGWSRIRAGMTGVVVALTVGQLAWVSGRLTPSAPAEVAMTPTDGERFLVSAMAGGGWGRVLRWPPSPEPGSRMREVAMGSDREDLVRNLRARLMPNLPAALGCRAADGDNPLVPFSVGGLLAALPFCGEPLSAGCRPLLEFLGVKWIVSSHRVVGGPRPRYEGRSHIYEVSGVRSPAWLRPKTAGQVVGAVETAPGGWAVTIEAAEPCELIVSESAVSGWRLVPPREAMGSRLVPGVLLGVRIPKGKRQVRLLFDPIETRAGMLIGCMALGAIMGLWGWKCE